MRFLLVGVTFLLSLPVFAQQPQRWSEAFANAWYAKQPWLVGSNYIPNYATNQMDMWQADTFNTDRIDLELGWAEDLGMTTMRVFLHDLLWQQDSSGFKRRIDRFLRVADKHHIKPILVLFDSCWNPFPETGPQPPPRPGIHNSRWLQSPGAKALMDPERYTRLLDYVRGVVGAFGDDRRILAWDVWNEPDNMNDNSYGKSEPMNKAALVQALLPKVFEWARAGVPSQPVTSGVWQGDWSSPEKLTAIEKIQLDNSDIITFHNYGPPAEFEKRVQWLQAYHRPIICTEYMARPMGSTFEAILPIAKKYEVGALNWGFAVGKSQTWLPWDSWEHPYTDKQPNVWFHDIFYSNGQPYSQEEVNFIRQVTSHSPKPKGKG
jgi:hypothetical protein